jgi:hypothetical protein
MWKVSWWIWKPLLLMLMPLPMLLNPLLPTRYSLEAQPEDARCLVARYIEARRVPGISVLFVEKVGIACGLDIVVGSCVRGIVLVEAVTLFAVVCSLTVNMGQCPWLGEVYQRRVPMLTLCLLRSKQRRAVVEVAKVVVECVRFEGSKGTDTQQLM